MQEPGDERIMATDFSRSRLKSYVPTIQISVLHVQLWRLCILFFIYNQGSP